VDIFIKKLFKRGNKVNTAGLIDANPKGTVRKVKKQDQLRLKTVLLSQ
jgi:hypothetical protein